jgi:hypothetical protein
MAALSMGNHLAEIFAASNPVLNRRPQRKQRNIAPITNTALKAAG